MGNVILTDKILKLIVEDISVTRPEQISRLLNIDYEIVLSSLKEMEKSDHIRLRRAGNEEVYVIVLRRSGRQFYKSSGFAELNNETTEDKKLPVESVKTSRKTLIWTIIGIISAILVALIVGYKQGWFS